MGLGQRAALAALCALVGCSDPTPPPHALLPGQSNTLSRLPSSPTPPAAAPAAINAPFIDKFDRDELGPDWLNTGAPYRLEHGRLVFSMAHNHPLWLQRPLPASVKIDFDCASLSDDGDIKVELYGDGRARESDEDVRRDVQYTATGYVFIFGGWKNSLSTLVKQEEHAWQRDPSVPRRSDVRVQTGRRYHWTITRTNSAAGAHFDWKLDGQEFMAWDDPHPLDGPGHDHFAFEGWETPVVCEALRIQPLAP